MRHMWKWVKAFWGWWDAENTCLVAGSVMVGIGVYQWWPPAAWITIGCILLVVWGILVLTSSRTLRRHDGPGNE